MIKFLKITLFSLLFMSTSLDNNFIFADHLDKFNGELKLSGQIINGTKSDNDVTYQIKLMATQNSSSELVEMLIGKTLEEAKEIKNIDIRGMNEFGSGGMNTKIEAGKICNLAGCNMIIANGLYENPISQIEKKNNCTWFISKISKLQARKKWIISSIFPKGELIIDDGAKKALHSGKSLLAAGIKKVVGRFNKGDHIKILDNKRKQFY